MARPKEDQEIDLTQPHDLTLPLMARLRCPPGKRQAFLRDAKCHGLRVRVTSAGARSFVFERWVNGATMRTTIGPAPGAGVQDARNKADTLRAMVAEGRDPRNVKRDKQRAAAAQRAADATDKARDAIAVGDAWDAYVAARTAATKGGKPVWGELHRRDHERMAQAGGAQAARGTRGRGVTTAGPLHPLMALRLRDLTAERIADWATRESAVRPTSTVVAWRLLRSFLAWCSEEMPYSDVVPAQNPAKAKAVRNVLAKPQAKQDALQKHQLKSWFAAVKGLPNTTAATYLQVLLLTGARPGEVLSLRWADVNQSKRCLNIRDKVEGKREIPLTPYVAHLLEPLPCLNEWVFASPSDNEDLAEKAISKPHGPHEAACKAAGIEGLTLHGLRRSFKSLSEWLEIPAGVVAQLMGHKPSATAEKHYTVRPLDLLAMHHGRIESWALEQAGIDDGSWKAPHQAATDDPTAPPKLRRIK